MAIWEDPEFWGNEAAEDETLDILNSYFVTKPEFSLFFDDKRPLRIIRAKKGMGKSALLRETYYRAGRKESAMVITLTGAALRGASSFHNLSVDGHIHDWIQRICLCVNNELGRSLQLGLSDDKWAVVEQAEVTGFKERNLLGALLARLKLKAGDIELQKLMPADQCAIARRIISEGKWKLWVLIDDVDATFIDTPEERRRTSTFFTALRQIAREFQDTYIRASVRSDVWTMIYSSDQALDKAHQYIDDIRWSNKEMGDILRGRVVSYLTRKGKESGEENPLDLVFTRHFPSGRRRVPPSDVIHRISSGRPRWALRLCRMAAQQASKTMSSKIRFGHMKSVMEKYGTERLADMVSEYGIVCPELGQIVNVFTGRKQTSYATSQLREVIDAKILPTMKITIDNAKVEDALPVARLLFRVGFLLGRRSDGEHAAYYRFEEKEGLLRCEGNLDDGMTWEIHPAFRAAQDVEQALGR